MFAGRRFEAGELLERAPVILVPAEQRAAIAATVLDAYEYDWEGEEGRGALVLGLGSVYNHSAAPNARYVRRLETFEMDYVALRAIEAGEEILVDYNGDSGDARRLVFDGARWWREDESGSK